jgi:hypothetical protein
VRLGRHLAPDLGLAAIEPVGGGEERAVCGARRERSCCGDKYRSCELVLYSFVSVFCSALWTISSRAPLSPHGLKGTRYGAGRNHERGHS